jgi:hypothetical protein
MLRSIISCVLVGCATAGCASLDGRSIAADYCLVGSGGFCSFLEGGGDCQPCAKSANNAPGLSAGSPADRNRTP